MECVVCKKDAKYRTVKGMPVCPECQEECTKMRDRLNISRTNPKNKFNVLGEQAITLREVVLRAIQEMQQKETHETT